MPSKTRTAAKADVEALLPDNASGAISPADLRAVLRTMLDSVVMPEDGPFTIDGGTVDPVDPDPDPDPVASDFSADFSADFGGAASPGGGSSPDFSADFSNDFARAA